MGCDQARSLNNLRTSAPKITNDTGLVSRRMAACAHSTAAMALSSPDMPLYPAICGQYTSASVPSGHATSTADAQARPACRQVPSTPNTVNAKKLASRCAPDRWTRQELHSVHGCCGQWADCQAKPGASPQSQTERLANASAAHSPGQARESGLGDGWVGGGATRRLRSRRDCTAPT